MLSFQLSFPGDKFVHFTVSACPDSVLIVKVRRGRDNLLLSRERFQAEEPLLLHRF